MGMRINTNVQSLAAQRSLSSTKLKQDKSLERLSSGNRIVRAGDDAAGLAISEKLKADVRGTQQATRNAGDGISMIQTAEGGLNEVSSILIRLRELSVQAASDTVGDTERQFSDLEFQHLKEEIQRIADATKFNGRELLNGQGDNVEIQIGTMNVEKNDRLKYNPAQTNATLDSIGMSDAGVISKVTAQENLEKIDNAINTINGNRANLGALQNRLQSTINNLEVKVENLSAANSRIRDTDVAFESAELTKNNILSASGVSVLAQANSSGQSALKLI
jgi:flagellin